MVGNELNSAGDARGASRARERRRVETANMLRTGRLPATGEVGIAALAHDPGVSTSTKSMVPL
jgi:hypothetical protein